MSNVPMRQGFIADANRLKIASNKVFAIIIYLEIQISSEFVKYVYKRNSDSFTYICSFVKRGGSKYEGAKFPRKYVSLYI
jgi:hypothetical protein